MSENFVSGRELATKGIFWGPKGSVKTGQEIDFYDQQGNKQYGKVKSTSAEGLTIIPSSKGSLQSTAQVFAGKPITQKWAKKMSGEGPWPGKGAKDRRAGLHRALDCVLDRRAAKDAAAFEVKQGRSGNWAVFKPGDDYPLSHWFTSKSQATTEMKRMGGASSKAAPKKEQEQPDIMGYPWETIQALQRKQISSSQMGSHAAAIRKSKGQK